MAKAKGAHVPERTCIECRKKAAKKDLLRIVRGPIGDVSVDRTGNAAGRGAYVCSKDCFRRALENGKLSRALRVKRIEEIRRAEGEFERTGPVEVV